MEKKNFRFSSINLGCTKNLVDTQYLIGKVYESNPDYNIEYYADPFDADVQYVFLNTCGFISSARDEMLDTLEDLVSHQKKIITFGCAINYYKNISKDLPDVFDSPDIKLFSREDVMHIDIDKIIDGFESQNFPSFSFVSGSRVYTNIDYGFEYLKIAEGCNNSCAFCMIPQIRGRQQSLSMEDILKEVKNMIDCGIKEIILIAQDTTRYGIDIYGKPYLYELLAEIDKIDGDFMYRVLYMYPDLISVDNIQKFLGLKKFIPYFDIPIQHASPSVLKSMSRFSDISSITKLFEFIRNNFEHSFIRTNIIIGFPGETDDDFQILKDFLNNTDFDNISLFEYHDEEFCKSYYMDNKVDYKTIHSRFLEIKKIVDNKLRIKEQSRKDTQQSGFVMDIIGTSENPRLKIRPSLSAPDIDMYDEISLDQITDTYSQPDIDIGSRISYIV